MNAIVGFTSLAKSHLEDSQLVNDYLGKIMIASQHLLSLINDVLDMSRIESGKVQIEEKPLCLPEMFTDIRPIIQSDVEAKGLDFSVEIENISDKYVMADKLRLNQVLINILGNAVKFTGNGGRVSKLNLRNITNRVY